MASTDARPFPLKNTAYRVTFPILDADGDPVSGAAGLDSEVSKDGGTFADCTNEATEIATSSGVYYLDLTSTELNADTVAIIVKTSTSGAKTTVIVLYPVEGGDIDVDVTYVNGSAVSTSSAQLGVNLVNVAGAAVSTSTAQIGVNAVQAGGTAWGSGAITAGAIAADAITAAKIAADAIGASELAADAATEIGAAVWATAARTLTANTNLNDPTAAAVADAVWDEARAGHVGAGSFGEGVVVNSLAAGSVTAAAVATGAIDADAIADNAIDAGAIATGAITSAKFAAGAINAAAIADDAIDAGAIAANAITSAKIASGAITSATLAAGAITAAAIATGAIDADALAADAVDEILDEVVEGTLTLRQVARILLAVLAGESTGGGTSTITFRDNADTKARMSATIDANRNRTAVTLDGS